jgi:hypothetical protein
MSRITRVAMPVLQTVGGNLVLNNLQGVTTLDFTALTQVTGFVLLQNMAQTSGGAVSAGFAVIRTVGGMLRFRGISSRGTLARTTIELDTLVSCGGMDIYQIGSSQVSFPLLSSIAGTLNFYNCGNLQILDFPSLATLSGRMSLTAMPLSNLCRFVSLSASGYTSTQSIFFYHSLPNLVQMPAWMAQSGNRAGMAICSLAPSVLIGSAAAYTAATSNTALMAATELAEVIVTWSAISDAQLATILGTRTVVGEVILDGCTAVTTTAPLGRLTNVTARLVLEGLTSLTSVHLPALAYVGASIRLVGLSAVTSVSLPALVATGTDLWLYQLRRMVTITAPRLVTVGGALNTRDLWLLSGTNFSLGFPRLQTIGGLATFWNLGARAPLPFTPIVMTALNSSGGMNFRENQRISGVSFPSLVSVGGLSWYHNTQMRQVNFPLLTSCAGFTMTAMTVLPDLCGFGSLQPGGYTSTRAVSWPKERLLRGFLHH